VGLLTRRFPMLPAVAPQFSACRSGWSRYTSGLIGAAADALKLIDGLIISRELRATPAWAGKARRCGRGYRPIPEVHCDSRIYGYIAFAVYGCIDANGVPCCEPSNKVRIRLGGCTQGCRCMPLLPIQSWSLCRHQVLAGTAVDVVKPFVYGFVMISGTAGGVSDSARRPAWRRSRLARESAVRPR
jgi:hypothetical protein